MCKAALSSLGFPVWLKDLPSKKLENSWDASINPELIGDIDVA